MNQLVYNEVIKSYDLHTINGYSSLRIFIVILKSSDDLLAIFLRKIVKTNGWEIFENNNDFNNAKI